MNIYLSVIFSLRFFVTIFLHSYLRYLQLYTCEKCRDVWCRQLSNPTTSFFTLLHGDVITIPFRTPFQGTCQPWHQVALEWAHLLWQPGNHVTDWLIEWFIEWHLHCLSTCYSIKWLPLTGPYSLVASSNRHTTRQFISVSTHSLLKSKQTPLMSYPPHHLRIPRGLQEADFEKVAHFFDRAVGITQTITAKTGEKNFPNHHIYSCNTLSNPILSNRASNLPHF